MIRQPHVNPYKDRGEEYRARIVAANGDILYAATQGYKNKDNEIIARELARRTLNEEFNNDPAYRERVEALMAKRDAKCAQFPFGSLAAAFVTPEISQRKSLAEALAAPSGIAASPMNRLLGLGQRF